MKICIVATDYPDNQRSTQEFVKQLVVEWADMGHECLVIAPFHKGDNKGMPWKRREVQTTEAGNTVTVVRPRYNATTKFLIGKFNLHYVMHGLAVLRGLLTMRFKPDFIYCHFWSNALEAYPYAKRKHLPLFVASGEGIVPQKYKDERFRKFFDYVKGTVCVSGKTLKENLDYGMTTREKSVVIPNAINPKMFHRLDQQRCRAELGLPAEVFIIIYVGDFGERKGVMRVSEAIKLAQGTPIYSIFIGKGELQPDCPNILHSGPVKHELLPSYLNAADCFVLPTQNEGCCNAIVEALACGLPVISADAPYNYDILSAENSIMINPNSVGQIRTAIESIRDDKEGRLRMADAALESAKVLTIDVRARRIISFITDKLEDRHEE